MWASDSAPLRGTIGIPLFSPFISGWIPGILKSLGNHRNLRILPIIELRRLTKTSTVGTVEANAFQDGVLDGRVEFFPTTDDSVSDGGGKCWTGSFLGSRVFLPLKGDYCPVHPVEFSYACEVRLRRASRIPQDFAEWGKTDVCLGTLARAERRREITVPLFPFLDVKKGVSVISIFNIKPEKHSQVSR